MADEPSSISEALAAAENAMIKYLVAKSQALQSDGCCSGPEWRGHLCQYHQGYADGVSYMLEFWGLLPALLGEVEHG